jgi:hypothetical protein
VKNHDLPVFPEVNGKTVDNFNTAQKAFIADFDRYNDDMAKYAVRIGDCVGSPRISAEYLQKAKLPAAFCDSP